MSVIDVAGGHQPVPSEGGQVQVVLNGEIYNDLNLRAALMARGRAFRLPRIPSRIDTKKRAPIATDAVAVKSHEMANKPKRENVHIIPHEIDLEVFRPVEKEQARAALGLDPGKKYLLFAANPKIPVKRFPLAKAVADKLQKQDSSIELLVIYKEPQDRLALFMSACDALIFTSYQEGSPNVVKQAMACNLPIVSTDVGDVRDVIGATKGCYVCKPDVRELADCLVGVLRRGERTSGREKVRHLSGPAVAQRVIKVYEQVLSKRKGHAVDRAESKPLSAGT